MVVKPTAPLFDRRLWFSILVPGLLLSGILLLDYPFRDLILVVAIVAATVFAFLHLETAWIVFLALVPLVRLSGGLFHFNSLWVSRFIIILWSVVYLVKYRDNVALRHLFRSNGFFFFALFVLANIVAALAIANITALLVAFTYLEPLLFFALSYLLVRRRAENSQRILQALLVGGFIVVVLGLLEMVTQRSVAVILNPSLAGVQQIFLYGWESNRFGLGGRISSLIGYAPIASLYFVLILTVAIYYLHTFERPRWLISLFALFGFATILLTLATGTRGGTLGADGSALDIWNSRTKTQIPKTLDFTGLILFVLGIFLFVPAIHNYIVSSLDFAHNSIASRNITGRFALTFELLRIFREHWFLGYGPGMVQKQAAAGILPTVPGIRSLAGIENQYATILADGGIVAGISYLLFMLGVSWQILQMLRQSRWRAMGLTLLALFAAYFVFAATTMTLTEIPNVLLMAIFGVFAAEYERRNENPLPGGQ